MGIPISDWGGINLLLNLQNVLNSRSVIKAHLLDEPGVWRVSVKRLSNNWVNPTIVPTNKTRKNKGAVGKG